MAQEPSSLWDDIVPRLDAERCRRCDECPPVQACLARALRRNGQGNAAAAPTLDVSACLGCYSCAAACPWAAIIPPAVQARGKV